MRVAGYIRISRGNYSDNIISLETEMKEYISANSEWTLVDIYYDEGVSNKIRCKNCGDIIESKYCHDYVECTCGACAVDGGHQYLRRCFVSPDCFEEMSEVRGEDSNDEDFL